MMTDRQRLTRADWLRAGRLALLHGGPAAVRIERLAAELEVSRGSFYWHFADRRELLEELLGEWEGELQEAVEALPRESGPDAFRELAAFLAPRVAASERGAAPSDAAVYAWAAADRKVAARVNAAEEARIGLLRDMAGDADVGEFLYLAYLGFVMRRRRYPAAAAFFPRLCELMERAAATLVEPVHTGSART
jgi:AcrR family transcriptional regulator